jgi:hypothetical protein
MSVNKRNEIRVNMNQTKRDYVANYFEPTHKPKIRFISDDVGECYRCTDGGLRQYGNTPEEAYRNLNALRNPK